MSRPRKTAPSRDDTEIVLGAGWQQFAFVTPGLTFLGTIRRGMEIGALAVDEADGYLQVNGDIHQALNKSRVSAHLRKAGAWMAPAPRTHELAGAERPAVPVVVKRRRRVLAPEGSIPSS